MRALPEYLGYAWGVILRSTWDPVRYFKMRVVRQWRNGLRNGRFPEGLE